MEETATVASAAPINVTYEGDICVIHGRAIYPTERELKPELVRGEAVVLSFEQENDKPELGSQAGVCARTFTMRTRSSGTSPFSIFRVAPREHEASRTAFAGYVAVPARVPGATDAPAFKNMSRVSGLHVTPEIFVAAGLTTAAKLDGAALSYGGKALNQFHSILDWGAGVGRVARHVRDHFASDAELWCVDVDGVNVEEAKNFVKNSICKPIPFYPPTDLPTDYFEFVYGISVFTHLSECAQEVWLQELKRVSRSGALLIMSVKNEFAAINSSANNGSLLRDLLLLGISDRWLDGNLGQQLDRKSYYRGTMHLTQYVREQWSRHFEIVDIVRRADVYVQDLVIMRRR